MHSHVGEEIGPYVLAGQRLGIPGAVPAVDDRVGLLGGGASAAEESVAPAGKAAIPKPVTSLRIEHKYMKAPFLYLGARKGAFMYL